MHEYETVTQVLSRVDRKLGLLPRRVENPRYRIMKDGTVLIDGHFPDCAYPQALSEYRATVAAFDAAHPKHCRTCRATGILVDTYDPSPPGVSLGAGYLTTVEMCPDCEERLTCGLCGANWAGIDGNEDVREAIFEMIAEDPNGEDFLRPCNCPRLESPVGNIPYCDCGERMLDREYPEYGKAV